MTGFSHVTDAALDWLVSNTEAFSPPDERSLCEEDPESLKPCARRKAYGELGLALSLCCRVDGSLLQDARVRLLVDYWMCQAHQRDIFFDLERRIHLFPLAMVNACSMQTFGHLDSSITARMQKVLNFRFIENTETSPGTKIDLSHYADILGLGHGFPPPGKILLDSSLRSPPALSHITNFDAYALTHLIFHLTSFGALPISSGKRMIANLTEYLQIAFWLYLLEEDLDIATEIYAALCCVGKPGAVLREALVGKLKQHQSSGGFIPGRNFVRWHAQGIGDVKSESEVFFDVYHPTLVLVLTHAVEEQSNG